MPVHTSLRDKGQTLKSLQTFNITLSHILSLAHGKIIIAKTGNQFFFSKHFYNRWAIGWSVLEWKLRNRNWQISWNYRWWSDGWWLRSFYLRWKKWFNILVECGGCTQRPSCDCCRIGISKLIPPIFSIYHPLQVLLTIAPIAGLILEHVPYLEWQTDMNCKIPDLIENLFSHTLLHRLEGNQIKITHDLKRIPFSMITYNQTYFKYCQSCFTWDL